MSSEVISVIICSAVSIVGFVFTYNGLKKEFLNSINLDLYHERKRLYIKTYKNLVELLEDNGKIFSNEWNDKLEENQIEICLVASKRVHEKFQDLYDDIRKEWKKYRKFCKENYWGKYEIEEYGNKYPNFTQFDIDRFEYMEEKYIENHEFEENFLDAKIKKILFEMKEDLKTNR